jgi:uncharacterized protein
MEETRRSQGTWTAMSMAIVISTVVAAFAWQHVKTQPATRTLKVTGSAKKQIVSDEIAWTAEIETEHMDRTLAYRHLHAHVETTLAYLEAEGLSSEDIRVSSTEVGENYRTEYVGIGKERIKRSVFTGFTTTQSIAVRSSNVALVERLSREVTQLLEKGVPISSSRPAYYYTKLGELKIEMLAMASRDARVRAENMVAQAGEAELGKLRYVDMGVINVNPVNSTGTSWQGNSDTTSLNKDIITVVHARFELN